MAEQTDIRTDADERTEAPLNATT